MRRIETQLVAWITIAFTALLLSSCAGTTRSERIDGEGRLVVDLPRPVDLAALEKAVLDEGHQPWRLDETATARAALYGVLEEHGRYVPRHIECLENDDLWEIAKNRQGETVARFWDVQLKAEVTLVNSRPQTGKGIWIASRARLEPGLQGIDFEFTFPQVSREQVEALRPDMTLKEIHEALPPTLVPEIPVLYYPAAEGGMYYIGVDRKLKQVVAVHFDKVVTVYDDPATVGTYVLPMHLHDQPCTNKEFFDGTCTDEQ